MLRVDVVLVPGGGEDRSTVLESICIANVGADLPDVSDYAVWRFGLRGREGGRRIVHKHRRADGWPALVRRAIEVLYPEAVASESGDAR
jgi:hypothetical protein